MKVKYRAVILACSQRQYRAQTNLSKLFICTYLTTSANLFVVQISKQINPNQECTFVSSLTGEKAVVLTWTVGGLGASRHYCWLVDPGTTKLWGCRMRTVKQNLQENVSNNIFSCKIG